MNSDKIVVIENLAKTYKGGWGAQPVRALKGISLEIVRGEVFGLLGPNGSGKTTTIKILLGLLFPTSGRCTIFGAPPDDVATKRRIGFLPEESYLYRFLNARETLDFYGSLSGVPRKERRERAEKLIESVGLTEAAGRPLRGYSKGMARRIGLAASLIGDPELVILDEPTSGLDPIGTREIKDLIIDLRKQGKTVLLCSHLLADVEDVCDRIAILAKGEVAASGSVGELLTSSDRIELLIDEMNDEEIGRVAAFVQGMNKQFYGTTKPRRKLEDLFLEVVAEHHGK
ncbi:MAG: ABC transporter ATP-binding protein [Planctomycetota bacterium]